MELCRRQDFESPVMGLSKDRAYSGQRNAAWKMRFAPINCKIKISRHNFYWGQKLRLTGKKKPETFVSGFDMRYWD